MRPIEETCYWLAHLPRHEVRPLQSPAETDVVVIGAGLTGLWTALFLKELDPAREVAVVEQGIAAWGASGRNAGMLAETLDHTHGLAIQHFGEAEAARLAALGEANVRELTDFLRDRDLRCDYEPTGRFMASFTEAHLVEARRNLEIARSLGIDSHRLLSREEMQAEVHSPRYLGGLEVRGGGILDPGPLHRRPAARGRAARRAGLRADPGRGHRGGRGRRAAARQRHHPRRPGAPCSAPAPTPTTSCPRCATASSRSTTTSW